LSLLSNDNWQDSYKRLVGKCSVVCRIQDIREVTGKADNGKPQRDMTYINLLTEAETRTVDGEPLPAGHIVEVGLGDYPNPDPVGTEDGDRQHQANDISRRTIRQLVVSALGLPANTKNAAEQLRAAGGIEGLKGKRVVASLSATAKGMQNVDRFAAVPATAAVA